MDKHGIAWPSQTTLVRKTGLCERAVRDALTGLKKLKLLHVAAEPTPHKSTVYQIVHTELPHSGSESPPERQPVPVKFPVKNQGNTKTRADAHAKEPDPGARIEARAKRGGTVLPGAGVVPRAVPAPGPSRAERTPRAQRSAANKAAWAAKLGAASTRVVAPPARVQPKVQYKPYQLPLPQGPLLRDMGAEARAELFRQARRVVFGK